MKEIITSVQNPKIKNVVLLLEKSQERRKQQLMVVEGKREITLALKYQYQLEALYVYESIAVGLPEGSVDIPSSKVTLVAKNVFEKMAKREHSDGLIAVFRPKNHLLSQVKLSDTPLVIVLESVEKPGNLGAILRTADAAKVDAVIICDPRTDIYNPNTIRSSIGCLFSTQVGVGTNEEVLEWLNKNQITSYAAALTAGSFYHHKDFSSPAAFIMGTEASGLTGFWLNNSSEQVKIPMLGAIDSLNVSTSTAILVFEAKRQRGF